MNYARAPLLLALLATGCPGDKADSTTSASGTDASTTTAVGETDEPTTTTNPTDATTTAPTTSTTDAPTTTSPTEATATATTTSGPDACEPLPAATSDCCCFTLDQQGASLRNDCPEMSLCGALEFTCSLFDAQCPVPEGSGGEPAEFTVNDMAALTCVLEALRDGEAGLVGWSFRDAESSGSLTTQVRHHVQADRRVFAIHTERADLNYEIADTTEQTLKDAAYFAGCLQAPDVRAMAICLHAATTGAVIQVCEPGGTFEDSI